MATEEERCAEAKKFTRIDDAFHMLYEVRPYDVVTYTGVVLGLGLLSLLATYLPARRATRVDPLLVLRQE